MAQIICKQLSLGYDSHAVVENLSFEVNAGDYLCIVGENGAGKSTLMKTLLGLQPALGGSIEYGGMNGIGYLPQQTDIQKDFPASVWEVVLSGCQSRCGMRPFYSRQEKSMARQAIDRMGMSRFTRRSYRELSGGQQQRVLLARALCAAEEILLLDEPTAGLDPKVTDEMYALISGLNENGTTIIMVSHDISAAVSYASHILHVGQDSFFGTTEQYLNSNLGSYFAQRGGDEA